MRYIEIGTTHDGEDVLLLLKRVVMRARVFVRDVEAPRESMATVRARGGGVWNFTDGGSLGRKILRIRGSLAFRPPPGGRPGFASLIRNFSPIRRI